MLYTFTRGLTWYDLHYAAGEVADLTDDSLIERWLRAGAIAPAPTPPVKEEKKEEKPVGALKIEKPAKKK